MTASAEQVNSEVALFLLLSGGGGLLLLGLLFLLLVLSCLCRGSRGGRSAHTADLSDACADDLTERGSTSLTERPLREAITASTWQSSTGWPVALRIAETESLAGWGEQYWVPFRRGWRVRGLKRIVSMVINNANTRIKKEKYTQEPPHIPSNSLLPSIAHYSCCS